MARFNKIFAGPVEHTLPQVQEAIKDTATLPGIAVKFDAAGDKFVAAGAADAAKLFIVQDNYLALKGVDDAWPAGDRIIGMEPHDELFFNVRVPTGQNIQKGEPLTTNASGLFVVAAAGNRVVMVAEETYNNTTGADQLVRARKAQPGMVVA
ncbi:hypothetical protein [Rhizobium phage RHph_X3_2]|nr:hypothetical protein [Rhizobium phage RHph_X3_2]